jgi:hypothetical protein
MRMTDREKVIDELNTDVLPFLQHHCDMQCDREKRWISKMIITVHDALALLKEQEAVEPEQVDVYGEDEWWGFVCVCPDCKTEWMCDKDATHFCPNCGRPVKWE